MDDAPIKITYTVDATMVFRAILCMPWNARSRLRAIFTHFILVKVFWLLQYKAWESFAGFPSVKDDDAASGLQTLAWAAPFYATSVILYLGLFFLLAQFIVGKLGGPGTTMSFTFHDEGFRIRLPNEPVTTDWSAVHYCVETGSFLLIYVTPMMAQFVPISALQSSGQEQNVRRILIEQLGERAKLRVLPRGMDVINR